MIRRLAAAVAVAVLASACASGADTTVTVAAASSMEPALREVVDAFEAANPGVSVTVTIGGSAVLRDQVVLARAPVDLLIVADGSLLAPVLDAGLADGPVRSVATNGLVLAVPVGNPGEVSNLRDLADPDRLVGLCAVGVPCGDLAAAALAAADVLPAVDTYEPNVRALATKLDAGELDAGLVYGTDVVASGGGMSAVTTGDPLPTTSYAAVVTTTGAAPDSAADFLGFLRSARGTAILAEYGFGPS